MHSWVAVLVCVVTFEEGGAPSPTGGMAESRFHLVTIGELPFPSGELERAIYARVQRMDGFHRGAPLVVRALGANQIELRLDDKRRIIAIGGQESESTLRMVALNATDLLLEEADVPAPVPGHDPTARTTFARSTGSSSRARVAVQPELAHGLGNAEATIYAVSAHVAVYWEAVLLHAAVGWSYSGTGHSGQLGDAEMNAWPIRAGAGVLLGPVGVALEPVVVPYELTGATSHSGALLGGGANATVAVAALGRMQLVASIGIDAFANRTAVRVPGSQVTFATPRFAPWLGLGLGWEMKP